MNRADIRCAIAVAFLFLGWARPAVADSFSPVVELSTLDGSEGFVLHGIDEGDLAGGSVAGAGDVNGDGFGDFLVGARTADPGGRTSAGEIYLVFGSADGFPRRSSFPPSTARTAS